MYPKGDFNSIHVTMETSTRISKVAFMLPWLQVLVSQRIKLTLPVQVQEKQLF